jgi:SAM-dependent methyltransferase
MLGQLKDKAGQAGLAIRTVEGDATHPPREDFDAVVERHLLWTLPDPRVALQGWDSCAPRGRLVLLESLWGEAGGTVERLRRRGHDALRRLRKEPPDHHREYDANVRAHLPLGAGATPEQLTSLVESTGWGPSRVERLTAVEWARRRSLPSSLDRALGVAPHFAVVAR